MSQPGENGGSDESVERTNRRFAYRRAADCSQSPRDIKRNSNALVHAALILASWCLGGGIQWGLAKASADESARRITALEQQIRNDTVQRHEYDARQKDIIDRLDRIENKLDRRGGH